MIAYEFSVTNIYKVNGTPVVETPIQKFFLNREDAEEELRSYAVFAEIIKSDTVNTIGEGEPESQFLMENGNIVSLSVNEIKIL